MFKKIIANLYLYALSDTDKYISKVEFAKDNSILLTIGQSKICLFEDGEINSILTVFEFNTKGLIETLHKIRAILGNGTVIDLVNGRVEFLEW